ncbi:hypothetical protein M758_11G024700 [Ceratodon purpureus]|nr:hypothetical protein M758_11G024700 [Ceratodon purpureus]
MGTPTILSSDVELTKTVYQQTNKLFDLALPSTTASILGKESLFFMKADIHKKVRNLIKVPFSVKELESFIPSIDRTCQNVTASWKNQEQIRVYHEAKKYVLNIAWNYLITIDTQSYPYMDKMLEDVPGATQIEKLAHLYFTTQSGMMALPFRIPGLKYYKALNSRKKIQEVLKQVIADRRSGEVECKDFLQSLLLPMEDGSLLTDDQVMDNIFTLLGASDVTTSTCLVWMVKNIHENPKVYKDMKAELDAIKKSKPEGELLTLEDLKKMTITTWTMNETLRMINVVGWFFGRTSDKDVQIKDVAIPKNWVIGLTHMFHLDERYFPEPEKFNPYRFEKTPMPFTFTPFGQGCRTCPGKDLARFEILTFFYHLITSYSWEPVEPNEGTCWHPFPHPEHLHPVKLTPRHLGDK